MENYSKIWKTLVTTALLVAAAGCSTGSSAPFHMYSSPLLESEMETPRSSSVHNAGYTPGVEPRQVYVYHRWHPENTARSVTGSAPARGGGSQATLANYRPDDRTKGRPASTSTGNPSVNAPVESQASSALDVRELTDHRAQAPLSAQFVFTTLRVNEIEISDGAAESIPVLYQQCREVGEIFHSSRPNIGDVVFFHNTFDANEDGRNNDWYTLTGIVEEVASDGTVSILTHRGDGVETIYLNRNQSDRGVTARGRVLNSELRAQADDDPDYTQYLAGQLFAGFCNILGDRQELILLDEWSPDMDL